MCDCIFVDGNHTDFSILRSEERKASNSSKDGNLMEKKSNAHSEEQNVRSVKRKTGDTAR